MIGPDVPAAINLTQRHHLVERRRLHSYAGRRRRASARSRSAAELVGRIDLILAIGEKEAHLLSPMFG
jgi:hypothetical protein